VQPVVSGETFMDIKPSGTVPSRLMPTDWFTGTVWQDPIIEAPAPARIRAARVTFAPGARTHWHTHPLGQTLHVVAGCGLVQSWGGPIRDIRPGDTVWFAPGEKHWHGAPAPTAPWRTSPCRRRSTAQSWRGLNRSQTSSIAAVAADQARMKCAGPLSVHARLRGRDQAVHARLRGYTHGPPDCALPREQRSPD
jgi:quercetin dioxygenase-like cupin family protein